MFSLWKKSLIIGIAVLLLGTSGLAHEKTGMPKKELKTLCPQADNFVSKPINLNEKQQQAIEKDLKIKLGSEKKTVAYVPAAKGRSLGMAFFTHAKGPKGPMDIGVVVNSSKQITKVALFDVKDKAIADQAFLSQFLGKSHESKFTDIKAPKGKEKEAKAITVAVQKALLIVDTVMPHT